MIAVFVKASVSSDHLDDFKASAQQLLAQTQAQDSGLVSYDFATLIEEGAQGEFAFFERWHSGRDLAAHRASAHFQQALASWEPYLLEPLEVRVYNLLAS